MIKLPSLSPKVSTLADLVTYQQTVDTAGTFQQQSHKAKSEFSARNKIGNTAFDDIKEKLSDMCAGARRCAYCEDSMADEVEHIYPKTLYPSKCFQWGNYLYACGPCNGPKNNKFAIFRNDNGQFQDVSPKLRQPIVQPVSGRAVMIDPRTENGMDFCILDLNGTFKFTINPALLSGSDDYRRADYTFNEILRLNDQREALRKARKVAYDNYSARLYKYDGLKKAGVNQGILDNQILGIQTEAHPTVWKEIQRYHQHGWLARVDADLNVLMVANPEALTW